MNAEWLEIPWALESPFGSGGSALPFNAFLATANPLTALSSVSGPQWILETEKCGMGSAKRIARDNMPQKSGEIIHRKYRSGLVAVVSAIAVDVTSPTAGEYKPACGSDLVNLMDLLLSHLNSMENSDGRLTWTPSGHANRMMLDARWLGPDGQGGSNFVGVDVQDEDNNVFKSAQFALLSPFPYAIDATEIDTSLADGTPFVADNTGTIGFWPVIQVNGPTSGFTISRTSALAGITQNFTYDTSFPGAPAIAGGHYVELDFFRETAYIDGSGANAKAGIDIENSDFWMLDPGNNTVTITGASATMKWQAAYGG